MMGLRRGASSLQCVPEPTGEAGKVRVSSLAVQVVVFLTDVHVCVLSLLTLGT